jgi:hypothetical protein
LLRETTSRSSACNPWLAASSPQDDTDKGANPQLVLSYTYWKSRFSGSTAVIGQTVRINGHPFTIVGAAPEAFQTAIGGYNPGSSYPTACLKLQCRRRLLATPTTTTSSSGSRLIARLKPGVTIPQAEAGLAPGQQQSLAHRIVAGCFTL